MDKKLEKLFGHEDKDKRPALPDLKEELAKLDDTKVKVIYRT